MKSLISDTLSALLKYLKIRNKRKKKRKVLNFFSQINLSEVMVCFFALFLKWLKMKTYFLNM